MLPHERKRYEALGYTGELTDDERQYLKKFVLFDLVKIIKQDCQEKIATNIHQET